LSASIVFAFTALRSEREGEEEEVARLDSVTNPLH